MNPDKPIVSKKSCNPFEKVSRIDFEIRSVSINIKKAKIRFEVRLPFLETIE
jgi:hypothetical protein